MRVDRLYAYKYNDAVIQTTNILRLYCPFIYKEAVDFDRNKMAVEVSGLHSKHEAFQSFPGWNPGYHGRKLAFQDQTLSQRNLAEESY